MCCRSYTALITIISGTLYCKGCRSSGVPGDPSASGIQFPSSSLPALAPGFLPTIKRAIALSCDAFLDFGLKCNWRHGWKMWVDWGNATSFTLQMQPKCLKTLLILAEWCSSKLFLSNNMSGEMVTRREGNAGGTLSGINAGIWQTGISDSAGISKAGLAFSTPEPTFVNKNFFFLDIITISKMFCRKRSSVNCAFLQLFLQYQKFRLGLTYSALALIWAVW